MFPNRVLEKIHQQRILHEVSLELTYKCNLNCFYCYNDRKKGGEALSMEQYSSLLKDLKSMQTMFIMLTGGEPMIHPYFFEIGRLTNEMGFVTRVRTNGHNLNKRLAKRVKQEIDPYAVEISLHGATAEVHDRQTRVIGSFERLCRNIQTAKESGLRISMVTTPTSWNQHQIDEMFSLCDSLCVPLRFQGPVAPRDNGDLTPLTIQPSQETWSRIKTLVASRSKAEKIGDQVLSSPKRSSDSVGLLPRATCGVGVSGVDIDPFGNVLPCMHLQEHAGNLHTQSIKDIWEKSPIFSSARQRAIEAGSRFKDNAPSQLGAPVFCIAVEANIAKHKKGCANCSNPNSLGG